MTDTLKGYNKYDLPVFVKKRKQNKNLKQKGMSQLVSYNTLKLEVITIFCSCYFQVHFQ